MAIAHVSEWGKEDRVGIKEIIKLYSEELFSEDWDMVLREQRVWDYRKKTWGVNFQKMLRNQQSLSTEALKYCLDEDLGALV